MSDDLDGTDKLGSAVNKLKTLIPSDLDTMVDSLRSLQNTFNVSFDRDKNSAFPVPSVRKYDECLRQGGKSVWTEDGFWRCLLKGAEPPNGLKQFKDITGYLDYQRQLLAQKDKEREHEKRLKQRSIRLISESEAANKTPISKTVESQTISLENGEYETRVTTTVEFPDGTALVKTKTENKPSGWFW